jgi:hypothetical protein
VGNDNQLEATLHSASLYYPEKAMGKTYNASQDTCNTFDYFVL